MLWTSNNIVGHASVISASPRPSNSCKRLHISTQIGEHISTQIGRRISIKNGGTLLGQEQPI